LRAYQQRVQKTKVINETNHKLLAFGYSLSNLDESPLPIEARGLRALIREGESVT